MRRLTRALSGGAPALALVLVLGGCGEGTAGPPEYGAGTPTAFVKLGPFQAPLPPPPSSSPPPTAAPSGAPTAGPSPTLSPPPTLSPRPQVGAGDLRPTRLGPDGHAERMYASLEAAEVDGLPEAREALAVQPAEGEVGLAFVLSGCRQSGARLEVEGRTVSASLTGGGGWDCNQPVHFLATFTVPEQNLPDDWTLPWRGR